MSVSLLLHVVVIVFVVLLILCCLCFVCGCACASELAVMLLCVGGVGVGGVVRLVSFCGVWVCFGLIMFAAELLWVLLASSLL